MGIYICRVSIRRLYFIGYLFARHLLGVCILLGIYIICLVSIIVILLVLCILLVSIFAWHLLGVCILLGIYIFISLYVFIGCASKFVGVKFVGVYIYWTPIFVWVSIAICLRSIAICLGIYILYVSFWNVTTFFLSRVWCLFFQWVPAFCLFWMHIFLCSPVFCQNGTRNINKEYTRDMDVLLYVRRLWWWWWLIPPFWQFLRAYI